MISGIYKVRNLINDKIYIGSSNNVIKRFNNHVHLLRRNTHKNKHLQCAWNKYGEENFVFIIIEHCEASSLLIREQYYLDLYTPYISGYNIASIAGRERAGTIVTEDTRRKISQANKGRIAHNKGEKMSKEQLEKMSKALTGLKRSDEVKKKLRENWHGGTTGKHFSEESKKKMSLAHIGKKLTTEQKHKMSLAQKGKPLFREKNGHFCSPRLVQIGN